MALAPNFKVEDRVSSALTALTLLVTVAAVRHGGRWWLAPVVGLAVIGLRNWTLWRILRRSAGWGRAFPMLTIHVAAGAAARVARLARAEHHKDRWLWPATAMIGLILLALQISSGAFQAEFMGHPDEAAQFVSGLMVYDYLAALPLENPIAWAGQYYLHYPKVAIGHWPPGYPVMEALWWLILGPSRMTGMLLQWLIGVVALTMLYRLCRSALPLPVTAAIIALAIATPVFQQNLELTMADLCCLLWSVLLMQATVRLLERQDQTAWFLIVLWLLAAALTKGTAVCLAPVPFVALLAGRKKIRVPPRFLAAGVVCLFAGGGWYLYMGGIRAWGAIYFEVPWPGAWMGHLAGWGFLALAVLGLRRSPLALVAGSFIVCGLGVSFVVRAMQEERHWIIALPAVLVLSGFAVTRPRRPWLAAALLLPALALFPYERYRQAPSGFADLLPQLALPSRMLVSSAGWGEGAWIAVSSLAEKRPASFVIRATKVLAETGWGGEGYRLITPTPDAVSRKLDELAVKIVVLHSPANLNPRPHHILLGSTIAESASWSRCGSSRDLVAYCRIRDPQVPRQPLRLHVYGWDFEERMGR